LVSESNGNLIRCSKAEISADKVSEIDGKRIVFSIPRETIRQIKLGHDTDVKHPFCQYFLGFSLLSLGLIGLLVVFFVSSGKVSLTQNVSGDFVLPLIPISLWVITGAGFWLLAGIFRARYHLLIETEKETRQIFFEKATDVSEIRQFIRRARMDFGYCIDASVLDKEDTSS
jgi:hypothetical protein